MMKVFDVYSYGVIATSTLYLLRDRYPAQGGYAEIAKKVKNVGGEAANTALVLSRLGLTVKLAGNWINPDDDAAFLKDILYKNNVNFARISFRKCRGPKEMLVVDSDSRTIFGTYAQLLEEKSWDFPEKTDIQNAQIICLDPFFGEASMRAVNYAKALKKPIVTVDCKFDDPILKGADIAIISAEFVGHTYPERSISSVTQRYQAHSGGTVIFTFGDKEIIYGSRDQGYKTFTPYRISPVDTTGAGDSFRAGIIYGLLKKWPMEQTIEFASAVAALVCQTLPGVLNSPKSSEVITFLQDYESAKRWQI